MDATIEVRTEDLALYTGGYHDPPAPHLEFGDWVSWRNHKGLREQGMFDRMVTDTLAQVRVSSHLYIQVRAYRLTVH